MRKINILYITPNFTIGGTEGQIFNLATHLDKTRFVPYVVSVGSDHGQREIYSESGIETEIFRITDFFRMVSFIKKRHIDIVHSFYYGDFSGWEVLASKLGGVKVFVTSRRNMGYWRKKRHMLFDIFRNAFTDLVIANSYAVRDKTIADEKLNPSKIRVIYNGVDCDRYSGNMGPDDTERTKEEFDIKSGDKVIGMVSNIKNIKGYDYFLQAARIIRGWGYNTRFVIAGEGSETSAFKRVVSRYGLSESLVSLGLCKDVTKIFSIMDVFMYYSLSEGFPNVILEAMAAEKPIVATDVGGTSEMLKDGYSGLLVAPRHAKALARAVAKVLEDDMMMRGLRQTARQTARENFSLERCVDQYESVYEDLCEKKALV